MIDLVLVCLLYIRCLKSLILHKETGPASYYRIRLLNKNKLQTRTLPNVKLVLVLGI